ncbi:Neutral alpha-glucosidase AB [Aphelenchoides bicaudatus]|nr:Neutral alpha-glucosidase AB [Aphelenchoides bicaudatus]
MFTWNDMNEPSVFGNYEMSIPRDVRHSGGWENREIHNIYGQCYHNSTYLGHLMRSNYELRPFILTRSFFTGSQRTTAIWTGDNMAAWSHLKATIPMVLSLSIAGFPNIGADVGGFFGNPDEELLVRWYQTGAFHPFFRAHAHIDTRRREPYLYGEKTREAIRAAIIQRYQLLPYWYTLFYEHTLTGQPVVRPIWAEFPEDEAGLDEEREFMLGSGLLIRPVMDQGVQEVSLYLPGYHKAWFDWNTGKMHVSPGAIYTETPLEKTPVYQRGGTIIPVRKRHRRSSKLMRNDPITLYIASELNNDFANGTLYLDDGESFAYQKNNEYMYWGYTFKKESNYLYTITSKNLDKKGVYDPDVWIEKIVIRGVRFYPNNVHVYVDDFNPVDLEFTHDRDKREVVIRKPNAFVSREWRIDIHT